MRRPLVIAIDGPSGAGKGTAARTVAARLAYRHGDTGAMYRAVGGVVMEGRDIGSVVFPQADVKVSLDAAPDERARRRAGDPAHAAGRDAGVGAVAEALEARDHTDRTRVVS